MIDDLRATRADLHARATFAADGERVKDTRAVVEEQTAPPPSAEQVAAHTGLALARAASGGFVEVD